MRRTALALALALALAACSKKPQPGAAPAPAGGAPAAAEPGAPAPSSGAFVTTASVLRREPTEATRVPGPAGKGKEVSNTLTVLQRGERVTVLEARGDEWAKVRTSDDRDGWLRRSALVEGDVTPATVLVPADVFDRPDLLAANARRRIDPGTLVLVVRTKAPFSQVNVSSGPDAWVLSERLSIADREVSVAKLTEKARSLVRGGKPDEAKQILALARANFAGSPLVDALAVELGEQAPAAPPGTPAGPGAPAVPAAAPVPASAPAPGAAPGTAAAPPPAPAR